MTKCLQQSKMDWLPKVINSNSEFDTITMKVSDISKELLQRVPHHVSYRNSKNKSGYKNVFWEKGKWQVILPMSVHRGTGQIRLAHFVGDPLLGVFIVIAATLDPDLRDQGKMHKWINRASDDDFMKRWIKKKMPEAVDFGDPLDTDVVDDDDA